MKSYDLSLIVPAYNEAEIIADSLEKIAVFVKENKTELGTVEVVVVAAGDDQTGNIARGFQKRFDGFQLLEPGNKVGKGRDVRLGFEAARGEVRIFTDADLSSPLHHILKMSGMLRSGADVVIGTRRLSRIHAGRMRSMLSVASNLLTRVVLLPNIRDTQCGFKGLTAAASDAVFKNQEITGWGFDIELLQRAKEARLKIRQMAVRDWHETRDEGLRGEHLGGAALTTLRDLTYIRLFAWGRSLQRHWKAWTLVSMLTSTLLAVWFGSRQSVWFDEAYSISLIRQSFGRLWELTSIDAHPPFYYLLLKVWAGVFGESEAALRALSAICGGLAVGLAALLVKRLFGIKQVVTTLPFLLLAPFLIRYNFEIRMYALMSLIGLGATCALVMAVRTRSKAYWAVYAVLVAMGLYTLYYSVFIWAAHVAWLLYERHQRPAAERGKLWKQPWLLAFVGAFVLWLPWLPTFIDQYMNSALSNVSKAVTYEQLVGIYSFGLSYLASWQLRPWESLFVVTGIITSVYLVVRSLQNIKKKDRQGVTLLALYMGVPVICLTVLTLPPLSPMFLERYLSHVIVAGYALLGVCIGLLLQYRVRVRTVVLISVFLLAVLSQGTWRLYQTGNFLYERLTKPHAEQIVNGIACGHGDVVIAGDPMLYYELDYYLKTCDLRFFHANGEIGARGGFASIYNSPKQVRIGDEVEARRIYYIYTDDPLYQLPEGYDFSTRQDIEKYHREVYDLRPRFY